MLKRETSLTHSFRTFPDYNELSWVQRRLVMSWVWVQILKVQIPAFLEPFLLQQHLQRSCVFHVTVVYSLLNFSHPLTLRVPLCCRSFTSITQYACSLWWWDLSECGGLDNPCLQADAECLSELRGLAQSLPLNQSLTWDAACALTKKYVHLEDLLTSLSDLIPFNVFLLQLPKLVVPCQLWETWEFLSCRVLVISPPRCYPSGPH
jgi:hypothetical protein